MNTSPAPSPSPSVVNGERVPMVRFNLFMPPAQLAHMEAISQQTGLSMSEHVRRALDGYISAMTRAGRYTPAA